MGLSNGSVTWVNLSFCRTQDRQQQEQRGGHSGNQDHIRRWCWYWSLQPAKNARQEERGEEMSEVGTVNTGEHNLHSYLCVFTVFISIFRILNHEL